MVIGHHFTCRPVVPATRYMREDGLESLLSIAVPKAITLKRD